MTLYVFCPRKSLGVDDLTKALRATRLKKFDGLDFWDNKLRFVLKEGDVVINWGGNVPELDGIRVLNHWPGEMTRYAELRKLSSAGVRTISAVRPLDYTGGMIPRLHRNPGWKDLTSPVIDLQMANWFTVKENFVQEYRIHSFGRRSIKAGVRVVRDGFKIDPNWIPNANLAHPWVRTYQTGWRVSYEGFKSSQKLKDLSHAAVEALGLTFGAVDIGERTNGVLKVIGVNRSPALSETLQAYVRKITKWLEGDNGIEQRGNEASPVR